MQIKVKDIAKHLGISPATVSLVLNNKPGISQETRQKVLDAIKELGYTPSSLLKPALKINRNIRFIIYKKHGKVVSDTPFFSALIEGIEQEAREEGFNLIISYLNEDENIKNEITRIFKENPVDGVLLLATEMHDQDLELFKNINIPLVILDRNFENEMYDSIVIANNEAIYEATKFLFSKGHREIGYIDSSVWIKNFEERKQGFIKAMKDLDLKVNDKYLFKLEPTFEGSYKDMQKILFNKTELPTAFIAANDILAFGALRALKENGFMVPKDVSIIGLDDMPFCEICDPPMTTMRVFKERMGKIAIKRLIERIEGLAYELVKIEVKTVIVNRNSVVQIE